MEKTTTTVFVDGKAYTIEELEIYCQENGITIETTELLDGDELAKTSIINPENSQRLISAIVDEIDEDYTEACKEIKITDSYHNWTSYASRLYQQLNDVDEEDNKTSEILSKEEINKYNAYVNDFNQYAEGSLICENDTVEDTLHTMQENSSQVR